MRKTKIAKAVAYAIAGSIFAAGSLSSASAATTMYNTFTTTNQTATDGWVYGFNTAPGATNSTRAIAYNASNPQALIGTVNGKTYNGFVGTDATSPTAYSTVLPFGYGGTSHLNWAVKLSGAGDSAEISQADALANHGFAAEIDTGGGAWRDNGSSNSSGIQTGWKHQTDVGLIKSDVTQNITVNLTNLNANFARFGVTVFEGMDTKTTAYVHHGSWNNPTAIPAANGGTPPAQAAHPYNMNNPFGTIGLTNIGYSDYVDSTAAHAFTFAAQAGQVYSLYLGGVDFGDWNDNVANYKLNLTTSPVPVPAAVWLFSSALAGFGVFGRRKKLAA